MLQGLPAGRLAELRRMETPAAVPVFWLLAARYPHTIGRRPDEWAAVIRILAILTARGETAQRGFLHSAEHRWGEVLCDGGDRTWPYSTGLRPVISEQRLAHLIAARGTQRRVLLERIARVIARTRRHGVNVADVALTLLSPGSDVGRVTSWGPVRETPVPDQGARGHGQAGALRRRARLVALPWPRCRVRRGPRASSRGERSLWPCSASSVPFAGSARKHGGKPLRLQSERRGDLAAHR